MHVKNELARRRYEKLVNRLESLMRDALKPECEGYYGHGASDRLCQAEGLASLGSALICAVDVENHCT
jgi:hypothetical protein